MFLHVRLFSLSIKDYSSKAGVAVFPSVVLDTITTGNAEAFSINRESGLGISPVTQLTVRKDLFVSLELPYSINFQETVTDTITTGNAEAFAINRESGLGISPVTQLTVRKDLFVSLELPYSINFQETVTVTPLVFYFGTNNSVTVSIHTCIYICSTAQLQILTCTYAVCTCILIILAKEHGIFSMHTHHL